MIMAILFVLSISFLLGLPIVLFLLPKHNLWGKLGLSYLLGVGVFTLVVFVTNLLGFKITALNLTVLLFACSLPLLVLQGKKIKSFKGEIRKAIKFNKFDLVDKILLGGIAFFVISSFISTLYWPVFKWDSLTLYDFRARVFIEKGFIKDALVSLNDGFYFAYPLLTSLLHTIVYIFGGYNPKFVYSLFYLSLGLVFYGLLREFITQKLSLFFTFVLLSVPQVFEHSLISYTNLAYLSYFSLGLIYYFLWDCKRNIGYLVVSVLLCGLSTWTRSAEALWLVVLVIIVINEVIKKRFFSILISLITFFSVQQVWMRFVEVNLTKQTTIDVVSGYIIKLMRFMDIQRWYEVIIFVYKNIVLNWGPVFLLFLFSFIFSLMYKKRGVLLIQLISMTMVIALFVGTFILSFSYPAWSEVPDSASRLAMIVYPLFIYFFAIVLSIEIKRLNDKKNI